jgi:predicted dehydrogenase
MPDRDDYALVATRAEEVEAPELDYRPPRPTRDHGIAVVGAGGISFAHLDAYRAYGLPVRAILSRDVEKADARAREFFPHAEVMTDYGALLSRDDISVVDLTPHPAERLPLIERALQAGKHVLSQKPFVTDIADGERLCDLADARGVVLAVNQNGRWAPHFAWMRAAVRAGLIGEVMSVHCGVHWDHRWIKGTPFEAMPDLVLYDFGVHWFDFVASITQTKADSVFARFVTAPSAHVAPPMLASVLMGFGTAQATLAFDAATPFGSLDRTYIAGSKGSLISTGPDLGAQSVELYTEAGVARPVLEGQWFNDGFAGAMGALLVAVETGVAPENDARGNLISLANCYAAIRSASLGTVVKPSRRERRVGPAD